MVKTFGHQAAAREQFRGLNDDVYHASFGAQFFSGLVAPATTFIGNLGYVAVAVVGGLQVATGQITLGSIQAFIQYVRQFNTPLSQVAGMYNTLQSGVASAERVFDLLDEPEEIAGPEPAPETTAARRTASAPERTGRVRSRELRLPSGHPGDRRPVAGGRTGQHGGDRRADRSRQNHAGEPADAVLRRRFRPNPDRRRRYHHDEQADAAIAHRHGAAGHLALRRDDRGEHRLRTARGQRR